MSEPLYIGGWGFSASIGEAWQAAFVWQYTKTLRLVRLRQRKTHQRIGRPSLASLPAEIMQMIEAEVIERELLASMHAVPKHTCGCKILADFSRLRTTRHAFNEWCLASLGRRECVTEEDGWLCDECWWAFEETTIFKKLWRKYCEIHAGVCQQYEGANSFWTMPLHACQEGFRFPHHGAATPVSILHGFLADHHLRVLRVCPDVPDEYNDYDEEEESPILEYHRLILVWKTTRRWSSSLMQIRTATTFDLNRQKAAYRLRRAGLLPERYGYCDRREKMLFRWRTAKLERLAILGKGLVEDPDSDGSCCYGCEGDETHECDSEEGSEDDGDSHGEIHSV